MPAASFELVVLIVIAVLASLAALFAALCFFRMRPQASALTEQAAGRILRSETDIVRGAVEDQARGLRQELGRTLASFQDVTLKAFGTLRDGIDVQIRTFGERLDAGVKATGESVTTISTKLTHDMEQMRGEANTGRENSAGNDRNVEVKPGSNQRVEYAIKLPGGEEGDGPLWLPIDAKFPNEDYERLVDASERGDAEAVEASSKAVEMRIKASAKDISDKYVHPPHSTDFAVLFLPTEGLFAEIIRRPGLVDDLQRECRIVVTGPTTLMALLNSLRMGFRTLAIQKRSSEVWQVLAAVKTEFGKYGEVLDKVQQKLNEASSTIEKVSVRRRAIDRRLRDVEVLPEMQVGEILSLPGGNGFNADGGEPQFVVKKAVKEKDDDDVS